MLDLVMWTYNGERTLSDVLTRLNTVIPDSAVNQKLVVDDGSTDKSREIAALLGWRVIRNEGKGISDAANTALKHVESKVFCSFEQDVLIAPEWVKCVPKLLSSDPLVCCGKNVAVASGTRVSYGSKVLYDIGAYEVNRYRDTPITKAGNNFQGHRFGMSLDNTCYNTEVLNQLGGFPKVEGGPGVDRLLAKAVFDSGYKWSVDYNVISDHIRSGVWNELKHYYWYGKCQREIDGSKRAYLGLIGRAAFSAVRGLEIGVKQHSPACAIVYPAIRTASLLGAVRGLI